MKVTLPKMAPALGPEWTVADEDVVGELGWRALLQGDIGRAFQPRRPTAGVATGTRC